jgi:hypothetical protein
VTDESLLAMHAVFGGVLERALMLVDKSNSVVELQAPGGRRLLQITGTAQGTVHKISTLQFYDLIYMYCWVRTQMSTQFVYLHNNNAKIWVHFLFNTH